MSTEQEFSELQRQIFSKMLPEQRWSAAKRLYWSARKLKAAALRSWHPSLSEQQIEQMVKEAFMYARS